MPQHIPLWSRKAIAARLCFYESERTNHLYALPEGQEVLDEVARELIWLTSDAQTGLKDDAEPLDRVAKTVGNRLVEIVDAKFSEGKNGWAPIERILNGFGERLEGLACPACTSRHVCDGREDDDLVVAERGHCVEGLARLFRIASAASQLYYQSYLADPPERVLIFSTRLTDEAPFQIDSSRFGVGGSAFRRAQTVDVVLSINPFLFDLASYRSILSMLMHECFVHGYEGTERMAEEVDAFSEGWMDLLSHRALELLRRGRGPAGSLSAELPGLDVDYDYAQQLHVARGQSDRLRNLRITSAPYVRLGRGVAGRVEEVLAHVPEAVGSADEHFLRLSLGINVLPLTATDRREFVERLRQHFLLYKTQVDSFRGRPLLRILRDFVNGQLDAQAVVTSVLAF